MTQLRSCYFCGTTGTLSEYATVPPDLRADGETSPRVVLCSRCHSKLTNVLTPIIDRFERTIERDGSSSPSETVAADAPPDDGELTSHSSPDQTEVTFSQRDVADNETTSDSTGLDSTETRESSETTAAAIESDDDSGTEFNSTTDTDAETADPAETAPSTETAPDDGVDTDDSTDDSTTAGTPAHLERVYHKLRRFLRNREFPVPRAEAETIAQSAYDLSAAEAADVIQLTIDRDVLEERDGELHRR